jgi:hypothetical protein
MNTPGPIEWMLFAEWLRVCSGGAGKHSASAEDIEATLKGAGFHPYIDGEDWPCLSHWYPGPIEAGMEFIWEPRHAHATQRVLVTEVVPRDGDETIIFCVRCDDEGRPREPNPGPWNEEGRFREACVPVLVREAAQ